MALYPIQVGALVKQSKHRYRVVAVKMRMMVGGCQFFSYEEGEIPLWHGDVIRNRGVFTAPEGYGFCHSGWSAGGEECFVPLILQREF